MVLCVLEIQENIDTVSRKTDLVEIMRKMFFYADTHTEGICILIDSLVFAVSFS